MTVLVTGGAGFIGSNLVDQLIEQGEQVVVVDNLSTGNPEYINPKAIRSIIDIGSVAGLNALEYLYDFTHIFHLAALSRVEPSLSKPELAFET